MRLTGGGTGSWSPVSRVRVVRTTGGPLGSGLILGSAGVLRREFCNASASGKDRDGCAPAIVVYNVDVWSLLRTTGTTVGLSIRVRRGRRRGPCVMGWTGGLRTFGQEGFDKVLIGTHVRTGGDGGRVGNRLNPLESLLVGNKGGLVDGIRARVTPDFAVSMTGEAARNDYTDDCTKHETANT